MKTKRSELISLRKGSDWKQRDVVSLLKEKYGIEITESYYGMIEQGARTPSLEIALAIAKLFDVSPEDIFFKIENNKKLRIEGGPKRRLA